MKRSRKPTITLDSAPWFDETMKSSKKTSLRKIQNIEEWSIGQKTLTDFSSMQMRPKSHLTGSMSEHPQYRLWKLSMAVVVILFLVVIGTSIVYSPSTTGYVVMDKDTSAVTSAVLAFIILSVFAFLVLLFYRQLNKQDKQ
jgi:hypothetical protein